MKKRQLGSLKDLVNIDDTYRCVMKKPTKSTTLHSESVNCVFDVKVIESFDDQGNSEPMFAIATLKSMTTKTKSKTSKPNKPNHQFLYMVAPERALYEIKDKNGKFGFYVVSIKNHEIVIPQSTQAYSRRIDMIREINRLWPHTAIVPDYHILPDQTPINDR